MIVAVTVASAEPQPWVCSSFKRLTDSLIVRPQSPRGSTSGVAEYAHPYPLSVTRTLALRIYLRCRTSTRGRCTSNARTRHRRLIWRGGAQPICSRYGFAPLASVLTRSKPASSRSGVRIRTHPLPPLWHRRPGRNRHWRCPVRVLRNTNWCFARFRSVCPSLLFLTSSSPHRGEHSLLACQR